MQTGTTKISHLYVSDYWTMSSHMARTWNISNTCTQLMGMSLEHPNFQWSEKCILVYPAVQQFHFNPGSWWLNSPDSSNCGSATSAHILQESGKIDQGFSTVSSQNWHAWLLRTGHCPLLAMRPCWAGEEQGGKVLCTQEGRDNQTLVGVCHVYFIQNLTYERGDRTDGQINQ